MSMKANENSQNTARPIKRLDRHLSRIVL